MKLILFFSVLSSFVFANAVEPHEESFLDIYSGKSFESRKVANVSVCKGKLTPKNCSDTRDDGTWCKVQYTYNALLINGYAKESIIEEALATPKNRKNFEVHFGGNRDDVAKAILALDDGAVVVGYTGSKGLGGDDAYILRVDNFGNEIFSLALGGERDEVFKSIIRIDKGFMLVGTSRSIGNARDNVYLAKVSNDGKLEWHRGYDSGSEDYFRANDIINIGNGNMLIVGNEEKSQTFTSDTNSYLNIIAANGTRSLSQSYGGSKRENANSVVSVKDGYVFAGVTTSWGNGAKDVYVVKIDKEGKLLWQQTYGTKGDEVANQIIPTQDNGFIVVGSTENDARMQKDIFVVKLAADGTEEWKKNYGTQEDEEGFGIVSVDDGYVIAGYSDYTSSHNSDVYIIKIDKKGKIIFTRTHGGSKDDKAYAIVKDHDGFLLTGYTVTADTYSKNIYILRVNADGKLQ